MNEIELRLARLRELMKREHLSAFIFPSTDAHQSEYVADHWRGREWISGFNGSAGTAVVTMKSAALWTDSRYFLAAEEQLEDTEYQLMRLKMKVRLLSQNGWEKNCRMYNLLRLDLMAWSTLIIMLKI